MGKPPCDRANTPFPTARMKIFEAGLAMELRAMSAFGARRDAAHLVCMPRNGPPLPDRVLPPGCHQGGAGGAIEGRGVGEPEVETVL